MISAVGFALFAAIQPVGLLAYIVILTRRGRRNTWGFIVGWVLCAVVVAVITVLLAHGLHRHNSSHTISSAGWLQIVVGLAALVLLGVRIGRHHRKDPNAPAKPEAPSRQTNAGPLGAAAVAVAVQGWPVIAAAVAGVLSATDASFGRVLGIALVIVLSTSTYLAAQILSGLHPEKTDARLESLRRLIEKDQDKVIDVVLLIAGVWILVHGIVVQLAA